MSKKEAKMVNFDNMTRNFVESCLLDEDVDEYTMADLLLEQDLFERGAMGAQIQAIFETMGSLRLTSNRDRNRMSLAQENMRKVRRHVKRIEERVHVLQEQVTILEESAVKSKKGD
jgi:septation ring formation regulator EzrA